MACGGFDPLFVISQEISFKIFNYDFFTRIMIPDILFVKNLLRVTIGRCNSFYMRSKYSDTLSLADLENSWTSLAKKLMNEHLGNTIDTAFLMESTITKTFLYHLTGWDALHLRLSKFLWLKKHINQ